MSETPIPTMVRTMGTHPDKQLFLAVFGLSARLRMIGKDNYAMLDRRSAARRDSNGRGVANTSRLAK